jgi:O-antigen/teichoic acid export membrane protein
MIGARNAETQPGAPAGPPAGSRHVDQQMARGAVWMVLARLLDRSIGLVSIMVLARLLVPADFGLLAMASSIIAIIELLAMFGFDVALIQNPAAGRDHYDTAWTFGIIFAAVIAAGQMAVATPAAWFYDEPRLEAVIRCLALGTLIAGFENIGVVAFRKELRFRKDFNLTLAKKIATFTVTIPAALILHSYWALIIGQVVGRLAGTILTYVVHAYRPRFSLSARRDLFNFGKWLVANNILNFAGSRCSDFLVGKTAGARQLGLFNLAYEIATLPSTDLIAPMNRAIFPGYAIKAAADTESLRRSYLAVISLVALVAVPAGVGTAALAELLVPVVLGPAWIDAAPCVAVLAVYGVLLAIKSNNHYVYLAMGRPWIATLLGTVQTVLLLPLVAAGSVRSGAFGAAVGFVVAQAIFTPISLAILCRALELRLARFVRILYRPVIAAAAMFLALRAFEQQLNSHPADGVALIVPLLLGVAVGVIVYVTIVYALWAVASKPDGPERQTLDVLQHKLWPRLVRSSVSSAP